MLSGCVGLETSPVHLDLTHGEPEWQKGGMRIQLGAEGGSKRLQVP